MKVRALYRVYRDSTKRVIIMIYEIKSTYFRRGTNNRKDLLWSLTHNHDHTRFGRKKCMNY